MPIELNGASEDVVGPIRNALGGAAKGQPNAFSARQIFSKGVALAGLALTDGSIIEWDLALGNLAAVTIEGNRTLELLNLQPGIYRLRVTQGSGGSHTIAFDGSLTVRTPGGAALALSTAAGGVDWLTIFSYGGSSIDVLADLNFQEI